MPEKGWRYSGHEYRTALISDIHGNLVALNAVFEDIGRQINIYDGPIDRIVCLGDIALSGPRPHECVQRIRELNCPVVKGNCDQWAVDFRKQGSTPELARSYARFGAWVQELDEWSAQALTDEDAAWLAALPLTAWVEHGAGPNFAILCAHGSPLSYNTRLTPDMSDERLIAAIGDHRIPFRHIALVACGHTHMEMFRFLNDASTFAVINPGSVGLPITQDQGGATTNPADYAEYCIVHENAQALEANFFVEPRRVPLDPEAVRADAIASGMPHADRWRGSWLEP
jgi:predicted phosphodiesterase